MGTEEDRRHLEVIYELKVMSKDWIGAIKTLKEKQDLENREVLKKLNK